MTINVWLSYCWHWTQFFKCDKGHSGNCKMANAITNEKKVQKDYAGECSHCEAFFNLACSLGLTWFLMFVSDPSRATPCGWCSTVPETSWRLSPSSTGKATSTLTSSHATSSGAPMTSALSSSTSDSASKRETRWVPGSQLGAARVINVGFLLFFN